VKSIKEVPDMTADADGNLHIYFLNAGQADSTVIITPKGKIVIIDAMKPKKLKKLLEDKGNNIGDSIEHLIITHPHDDHYGAANFLTENRKILQATFAPFWNEGGMGAPAYMAIMASLYKQDTKVIFQSGYSRWYPEDVLTQPHLPNEKPEIDPKQPCLEILGPTNQIIRNLEESDIFDVNHLSLMCRFTWNNFSVLICGDAQMENWNSFDDEHLMEEKCTILRTAHHGSKNGTQWERLKRLSPSMVIISSHPEISDKLPDLPATAVFTEFEKKESGFATITKDTGTIHVKVSPSGRKTIEMYKEKRGSGLSNGIFAPLFSLYISIFLLSLGDTFT
jgi:competence protein ComEC